MSRKLFVPFVGLMTCTACGASATGGLNRYAGGWRAVDADRRLRYYACPQCHPSDVDSPDTWKAFFLQAVRHLYERNGRRAIRRLTIWRETLDGRAEQAALN